MHYLHKHPVRYFEIGSRLITAVLQHYFVFISECWQFTVAGQLRLPFQPVKQPSSSRWPQTGPRKLPPMIQEPMLLNPRVATVDAAQVPPSLADICRQIPAGNDHSCNPGLPPAPGLVKVLLWTRAAAQRDPGAARRLQGCRLCAWLSAGCAAWMSNSPDFQSRCLPGANEPGCGKAAWRAGRQLKRIVRGHCCINADWPSPNN